MASITVSHEADRLIVNITIPATLPCPIVFNISLPEDQIVTEDVKGQQEGNSVPGVLVQHTGAPSHSRVLNSVDAAAPSQDDSVTESDSSPLKPTRQPEEDSVTESDTSPLRPAYPKVPLPHPFLRVVQPKFISRLETQWFEDSDPEASQQCARSAHHGVVETSDTGKKELEIPSPLAAHHVGVKRKLESGTDEGPFVWRQFLASRASSERL